MSCFLILQNFVFAFKNFSTAADPTNSSVDQCNTSAAHAITKRQRGEKRPIPDEQKDEKYYERRRRNNQAAKKSRDARKFREDQVEVRFKKDSQLTLSRNLYTYK